MLLKQNSESLLKIPCEYCKTTMSVRTDTGLQHGDAVWCTCGRQLGTYECWGPSGPTGLRGVKHDKEKRQWALLPWREVGVVVDVLTYGCRKYSADNWMHVPGGERRYFEAAMRHITARQYGQINDKESRLPHLAHACCCLLFWMWFDNKNKRGHR